MCVRSGYTLCIPTISCEIKYIIFCHTLIMKQSSVMKSFRIPRWRYGRCFKMIFIVAIAAISIAYITGKYIFIYDENYTVDHFEHKGNKSVHLAYKKDPFLPRLHHSINDHIYFMTYNGKNVFTNQDTTMGMTVRRPYKLEKKMFKQVQNDALISLSKIKLGKASTVDCNSIRYRFIPSVGAEFDVTCYDNTTKHSERMTFLQKFLPSEIIFHYHPGGHKSNRTTVNVVVPLMGRPRTFRLFLKNIQLLLGKVEHRLGLTVVYFNDTNTEEINKTLATAQEFTKGLQTHFILLKTQPFSRSMGLQVGVEQTKIKSDVIFLSDVDIFFTSDFLRSCQNNAVEGSQVYFPMVFSLFNPEFIYPLQGKKMPLPLETHRIGDEHGYWRVWGHGMACLHKTDFLKIRGFNMKRSGWGGEDISFLGATINKKYKVIRALEPGLYHHYHYKNCAEASKGQGGACRRIRAKSEAAATNLGLWYYKLKYNTSVYGLLKDGQQPYSEKELKELEFHPMSHVIIVYIFLALSLVINMILLCSNSLPQFKSSSPI